MEALVGGVMVPASQAKYLQQRYLNSSGGGPGGGTAAAGDTTGRRRHKKKKKSAAPTTTTTKRLTIVDEDAAISVAYDDSKTRQEIEEAELLDGDDDDAPVVLQNDDLIREERRRVLAAQSAARWITVSDGYGSGNVVENDRNNQQPQLRPPPHVVSYPDDLPSPAASCGRSHFVVEGGDLSPPRLKMRQNNSDDGNAFSPSHLAKRVGENYKRDLSPPRQNQRHDSDSESDLSLPRRKELHDSDVESDLSPPRRKQRHDSDVESDLSPPRRKKRHDSDVESDLSPPRRKPRHDFDVGSDLSPLRCKQRYDSSDFSPPRLKGRRNFDVEDDLSPPLPKKCQEQELRKAAHRSRMSSGMHAGIVAHSELKERREMIHKQEKEILKGDSKAIGKDAEVVFRDSQGRKVQNPEELLKKEQERIVEEKREELEWGKGRVQKQHIIDQAQRLVEERELPFSQYQNDKEIDDFYKQQERWGDPMLGQIEKPQKTRRGVESHDSQQQRPKYKGIFPPNRYNIPPDYYWDGVDRSNGFERRLFEKQAQRNAQSLDKYLWSVSDM